MTGKRRGMQGHTFRSSARSGEYTSRLRAAKRELLETPRLGEVRASAPRVSRASFGTNASRG